MIAPPLDTTEDAVLGGRLRLQQPRRGHRVGHDAILLAAAVAAGPGDHAVDLGAGIGAAGLALACRVPALRVTLVDIDPALIALADANAIRNGFAARVSAVVADVTAPPQRLAERGLMAGCADQVLMNPPFNDAAAGQTSPDPARARAHVAVEDMLASWLGAARHLLTDRGAVTLIWRGDGFADVLAALAGFGGIAILPVHPRADAAAVRVLVGAVKNSRAPMRLLPGLVLNDEHGRPTAAAEAVLRDAAPLPLA
jgi:tRNA1(Val) A37 N6-methylase TrmN6